MRSRAEARAAREAAARRRQAFGRGDGRQPHWPGSGPVRGIRGPNAKAPPAPTKTLTVPDGTPVEAVSVPFDRSGNSTAVARLADGTEIEVGMEITKVFRGVIDRGDHYEVVHSMIFEQSLTTSGVPPMAKNEARRDRDEHRRQRHLGVYTPKPGPGPADAPKDVFRARTPDSGTSDANEA